MTISEWVDGMCAVRLADGGFGSGEREAYTRGLIEGMLAFLARERTRHMDDVLEINTDASAMKRDYPWLREIEPREHVRVG